MANYDVVITLRDGCRFIGETTASLSSARGRLRWESTTDGRKVEIIRNYKDGKSELIESTEEE